MSDRLIALLLPLSPRERMLIALCVGVVLPLAIIFGLLLPMAEGRKAAERAHVQAQALHLWVQDRAAEAGSLTPVATQPDGPALSLAGIEQSLIDAKLRDQVTALSARSNGGVELVFDQVDFVRFATWLSSSHPGWGYALDSYRTERTDTPSKVAASLILSPR
ncbi:type II secretion system protein GspM [Thalassovita sp.]|jgi:type II secretory pathway component PulM|uniref:type II secretion system protein GspM n=1 Tax=Thalassovita sp. TaxID=1979401 RepID=UPI003B5AFC0C